MKNPLEYKFLRKFCLKDLKYVRKCFLITTVLLHLKLVYN